MKLRFGLIAACVLLTAACSEEPQYSQADPWYLPEGNPEAGRQAFVDLRCNACHAVPDDSAVPEPYAETKGPPMIYSVGMLPTGDLVSSIIAPSHYVPEYSDWSAGGLSKMGDYSEAMTVRQMVDLVAYIRSFAPKDK